MQTHGDMLYRARGTRAFFEKYMFLFPRYLCCATLDEPDVRPSGGHEAVLLVRSREQDQLGHSAWGFVGGIGVRSCTCRIFRIGLMMYSGGHGQGECAYFAATADRRFRRRGMTPASRRGAGSCNNQFFRVVVLLLFGYCEESSPVDFVETNEPALQHCSADIVAMIWWSSYAGGVRTNKRVDVACASREDGLSNE